MIVYYVTSQPLEILRFVMFIAMVVLTSLVAQSHALLIGAACKVEVLTFSQNILRTLASLRNK